MNNYKTARIIASLAAAAALSACSSASSHSVVAPEHFSTSPVIAQVWSSSSTVRVATTSDPRALPSAVQAALIQDGYLLCELNEWAREVRIFESGQSTLSGATVSCER